MIEYGLMVALIGLVVVVAAATLGSGMSAGFHSDEISNLVSNDQGKPPKKGP